MGKPEQKDSQASTSKPTQRKPTATDGFAREADLREAADHECLGGCDLDHCERMHRG